MTFHRKRLLAVIVPIQVVLAVIAWRDLAARSDDHVPGKKNIWRATILLNPGNSVFYGSGDGADPTDGCGDLPPTWGRLGSRAVATTADESHRMHPSLPYRSR